jgi:putative hydrolase of HD superfamily
MEAPNSISKHAQDDLPYGSARLHQQISFIVELDKLKHVLRQNLVIDKSRPENVAEHSWHLGIMAVILAEFATPGIDILRVLKMLLIHDIVEIDAGDTFLYDTAGKADQAAREAQAAVRLFGLLPENQRMELRALWDEFEKRQTADAMFAKALDRFAPLLHNYYTEGSTWRRMGIAADQVRVRNSMIADGSELLWQAVQRLIADGISRGYLEERTQ